MFNKLANAVLPPPASTFAEGTDWMFYFITWVCIVFFVLILALMVYFVFKYKRKSEDEVTPNISHNLALEVTWSVIPIIIVIFMFYWGYKEFARMNDPAALFEEATDGEYIDLYLTGKQWSWDVAYPNGIVVNSRASLRTDKETKEKMWGPAPEAFAEDLEKLSMDFDKDGDLEKAVKGLEAAKGTYTEYAAAIDKTLGKLKEDISLDEKKTEVFNIWARVSNITDYITVPEGIPVRLNMTSNDVIHSFAVPAFRIKKDVIQNRTSIIWFKAIQKGTFIYTCNEMCGDDHGHMIGYLRVVSKEEYAKYLKAIAGPLDPWDLGKKVYEGSCANCHSIDGSAKAGPTWQGLFGKKGYEMSDGSKIDVNEDYLRESIKEPSAKKHKDFANGVMPVQTLTPEQFEGVIQFIKSPNKKPEN